MQKRHKDRRQYFSEQRVTTKKYVITYIEEVKPITKQTRVLEIGCGEGGNLIPFIEIGCDVVGVDLDGDKIASAQVFTDEIFPKSNTLFLHQNIYNTTPETIGRFDIIILRDVIEHIPNQELFLGRLKSFLNKDGVGFFGFPPWCMPFGGHQQMCKSNILQKMPYFHLLPTRIYKIVLQLFGESKAKVDALVDIKKTGIGINRFQQIVTNNGLCFIKKTCYLINPNYEVKFGLKPRKQFRLIQSIPFLRDFLTTCYYAVVTDKQK